MILSYDINLEPSPCDCSQHEIMLLVVRVTKYAITLKVTFFYASDSVTGVRVM